MYEMHSTTNLTSCLSQRRIASNLPATQSHGNVACTYAEIMIFRLFPRYHLSNNVVILANYVLILRTWLDGVVARVCCSNVHRQSVSPKVAQ
jgi:hypothetical protein